MASDCYIYQTGGIANVVLSLTHGLREQGHDVRVLALSNSKESYKDDYSYFIASFPVFYYPEQRRSLVFKDPLFDELIGWKPDIIHLHTEGSIARMADMIAKATGAPIVMTTHTDYAHFIFGRFKDALPIRFFAKVWGRSTYKRATAVIAPSEKAKHFLTLQSVADRVRVVPNGIEPERYTRAVSPEKKAELFHELGLTDNGHTMVMVSRVSKEKNIREIIRYMPTLLAREPEAQLIIAGDGPDRKMLEERCSMGILSEHVRFLGRIDPDEVYLYYAMGDFFVSASTFEVHSMSYLEAMACGLPLICRDDTSLKGVLKDGENGFIYRSEEEFFIKTEKLFNDPELRKKMSENALLTAAEFTAEKCVERTYALYEEVLA